MTETLLTLILGGFLVSLVLGATVLVISLIAALCELYEEYTRDNKE